MADYYAGQYDLAIHGFEAYVKTFPQSPQATDAQLPHRQLVSATGQVRARPSKPTTWSIRNYPQSDMLAEAYYRKGTALKNLKQTDEARAAFEFVIKNYPRQLAATRRAAATRRHPGNQRAAETQLTPIDARRRCSTMATRWAA